MDEQKLNALIERYKNGVCSSEEIKIIERFIGSFQTGNELWIEGDMGKKELMEEKIFSSIMHGIKSKEKVPTIFGISTHIIQRAAAIMFLMILASGVLYVSGIFNKREVEFTWKEKVAKLGENAKIQLPDGTNLILSSGSKLRYPDKFSGNFREVSLEGEAYFDVFHNSSRPFIVHSQNLSTTVLGTRFNIAAFHENNSVAISLFEGSVKIAKTENEHIIQLALLKPKQQLVFNKENNNAILGTFDSLDVVGWRDSIYKFENKTLAEVIPQLERSFNVKINFEDPSMMKHIITIKFEKKSINTILDVIKNLTGLNYTTTVSNKEIKEILFYRKKK